MTIKRIYLLLAIAGGILPYLFFSQFIVDSGLDIPAFISSLFVTPAASGFTADLLFTSFVFWFMMFRANKKENGPNPLLFIILNLTIGLSCAFPAYLYATCEE